MSSEIIFLRYFMVSERNKIIDENYCWTTLEEDDDGFYFCYDGFTDKRYLVDYASVDYCLSEKEAYIYDAQGGNFDVVEEISMNVFLQKVKLSEEEFYMRTVR